MEFLGASSVHRVRNQLWRGESDAALGGLEAALKEVWREKYRTPRRAVPLSTFRAQPLVARLGR